MNIIIEKKANPSEFLRMNLRLLKLYQRRNYLIAAVVGVLGLTIAVYEGFKTDSDSILGLGASLVLFAIFIVVYESANSKKYKSNAMTHMIKMKDTIRYEFTEEVFKYSDHETEINCKWSSFTHFQKIDNFILITNQYNATSPYFFISENDLDSKSRIDLLAHLGSRLTEKKKR